MHKLYSKLQFVVFIIVSIGCNVEVFLDFKMDDIKKKLFLGYLLFKSLETRVLLVYVSL